MPSRLSTKETAPRDKLDPTIKYLQKLGPENIQQIFQWSKWTFDVDPDIALETFTLEESELPRHQVADFLEGIDQGLCIKFIEHLINELHEASPAFHDRLADLYLHAITQFAKAHNEDAKKAVYTKFIEFIGNSQQYRADRLFGHLPSDDLYEARAILLGKLGRHEGALEIYVYRLKDYAQAEEYCKRVYRTTTDTNVQKNIFLMLLRIYLRPPPSSTTPTPNLLTPALALISRHSPRLDPLQTIQLLPPLVPAGAIQAFLTEALRQPRFDTRLLREVCKARDEELARKLITLQSRRVRVDDTRICPQCHKRIGNSVIAVHAPRGEVTHYQCREAFSRKLREGAY